MGGYQKKTVVRLGSTPGEIGVSIDDVRYYSLLEGTSGSYRIHINKCKCIQVEHELYGAMNFY